MTSRTVEPGRDASLSGIAKHTFREFGRNQCTTRAAALSYSTTFALPPLLILLIRIAGRIWDPVSVRRAIEGQFAGMIGEGGAGAVAAMLHAGETAKHGALATALGVVGLIAGATGAFLALQDALNAVWEVQPDPEQGGIRRFITKRLLSLGMVMGVAFLLVVSLAITAVVAALAGAVGVAGATVEIVNLVLATATLAVLFAAIYKVLPDAAVAWRSVWVGGVATAILFQLGKVLIGLYLGRSKPGNAFGAASALAVILVWIYYAGMLVLLGAVFTRQWARAHGHPLEPKAGAVRVTREKIVRPLSGAEAPR